jgi:hypothetical protein
VRNVVQGLHVTIDLKSQSWLISLVPVFVLEWRHNHDVAAMDTDTIPTMRQSTKIRPGNLQRGETCVCRAHT